MESITPMLPPQVDVQAEIAKLDEGAPGRGEAMIKQLTNQINRLESGGDFSTEEAQFIRNMGATAFGVRVLAKMMNQRATQPIPVGPSLAGTGPSKEDWQAMIADPKYWDKGPVGEAHRAKVRALGERLFPGYQE